HHATLSTLSLHDALPIWLPQINVFIKPGHSAELYDDVERGELDAALVLQAPFELPKTCRWELLREEPLVVLVPEKFADRDPHEVDRKSTRLNSSHVKISY